MSKHSKWSKIKRQKAVTDVRRGQLFSKLSKAITVAVREGGTDPLQNIQLRMAMDHATAENMPKESIERAREKAAGKEGNLETLMLEGHGPAGSAFLIKTITDNRNRSVSEVRKIMSEAGGNLGKAGDTKWLFSPRGYILLENAENPEEAELAAIDAGSEETKRTSEGIEVTTSAADLHAIKEKLAAQDYRVSKAALVTEAKTLLPLPEEKWRPVAKLKENLENHEDVVEVSTNAVPQK